MSKEIKRHFKNFLSHSHNSQAHFLMVLEKFSNDERSDVVLNLSSAAFHCKIEVHHAAALVKIDLLVSIENDDINRTEF